MKNMLKRGAWIVLLILLINLATALEGDFNNDGCVKFDDYLDFVGNFNKPLNQENKIFDLDNDLRIGISDFLIFADNFNKCAEVKKETVKEPMEKTCSQCGDGIFNRCDTNECSNLGNCVLSENECVSLQSVALTRPAVLGGPIVVPKLKGDFNNDTCVDKTDFDFADGELKDIVDKIKNHVRVYGKNDIQGFFFQYTLPREGDSAYLNKENRKTFSGYNILRTWWPQFDQLAQKYDLNPRGDIIWDEQDKNEFMNLVGQGNSCDVCSKYFEQDERNKCLIIAASKPAVNNPFLCNRIKDRESQENQRNMWELCTNKVDLYNREK